MLVSIGGVTLSHIAAFVPTHEKIVNFERDSTGAGHIDLVTYKWKLQITFSVLSSAETKAILNATKAPSFSVTFYDPESCTNKTITCYEGNKNFPFWKKDSGGYATNGGTLNLIEL